MFVFREFELHERCTRRTANSVTLGAVESLDNRGLDIVRLFKRLRPTFLLLEDSVALPCVPKFVSC